MKQYRIVRVVQDFDQPAQFMNRRQPPRAQTNIFLVHRQAVRRAAFLDAPRLRVAGAPQVNHTVNPQGLHDLYEIAAGELSTPTDSIMSHVMKVWTNVNAAGF